MKVLHIITRLDLGGSSKICLDFCKILKESNYEVFLLSGKTKKKDLEEAKKNLEENSINFLYLPYLQREINFFKDFFSLIKIFFILKKLKPDILHLHSSKAGFIGRISGFFAGIQKIIYMPHGHVFRGYFSKFKSFIFLILERILFYFVDILVSLTEREIEEWVEFGFERKKFFVINNGIKIEEIEARKIEKNEARKRLKIALNKKVILCVSRLEYVKGIDILIKSLSLMKERKDFILLIAGDGSLKEELKKIVLENSLNDKVIFLGERRDIPEVICSSDFLVLPSRMEGFGISILEGYVFEKPSIGAKVGGIPEVIIDGKTGLLFEKENIEDLKEKILFLLENEEKVIEYGKNGRKYLEEKFSYEKMRKRLLDLYRI